MELAHWPALQQRRGEKGDRGADDFQQGVDEETGWLLGGPVVKGTVRHGDKGLEIKLIENTTGVCKDGWLIIPKPLKLHAAM
jgi:hypothetical protein